jgi:hypothetical protein
MPLHGPEAQGLELIRDWLVASDYAGTVVVGDTPDIPVGDFVVIDVAENGANFVREGVGSYDGTVDIVVSTVIRTIEEEDSSDARLEALSLTSQVRRFILDQGASDARLSAVSNVLPAVLMAETYALPGAWSSQFTLTLLAQP